MDKLNCKFGELTELKNKFDELDMWNCKFGAFGELDKLKDELDELDKFNCKFDEFDELKN